MAASNLRIHGTRLTLDFNGESITADLSKWAALLEKIGGSDQIQHARLHNPVILEFPGQTFVSIEDFAELARRQSFFKTTLAALTKNQI